MDLKCFKNHIGLEELEFDIALLSFCSLLFIYFNFAKDFKKGTTFRTDSVNLAVHHLTCFHLVLQRNHYILRCLYR